MSQKKIKRRQGSPAGYLVPVPTLNQDLPRGRRHVFTPAKYPEGVAPEEMTAAELWTWMMEASLGENKRGAFARATRDLVWHKFDPDAEDCRDPEPQLIPKHSVVNIVTASRMGDLGITYELDAAYGYVLRLQAVDIWWGDDAQERMESGDPPDFVPAEPFLDRILPYTVTALADVEEASLRDAADKMMVLTSPGPGWKQEELAQLIREQPSPLPLTH